MQPPRPRPRARDTFRSSLGSDAPFILSASPKSNHVSTAALEKPRCPYPIFWRPDFTAPGFAHAGLGGAP